MNNDIKQKLKNAGFQEVRGTHGDVYFINNKFKATVHVCKFPHSQNENTMILNVSDDNIKYIEMMPIKDLAELNKLCYGHIFQDLNFEAKKYTWAECLNVSGFYVNEDSHIHQIHNVSHNKVYKNTVPTRSNAESIEATTQLMQISARINADFEQVDGCYYYPCFEDGKIDKWKCPTTKINQFKMNSKKAIEALIETNTPLLLQYFEQQTT